MSYEIPKQITKYTNKFLVGTLKQDLMGGFFILLLILEIKFLSFSFPILVFFAFITITAGALAILFKIDEKIVDKLIFPRGFMT